MNVQRTAALALVPLVAAPALVLAGSELARADDDRDGAERADRTSCAGSVLKLEAEKDDGRFEVEAEVDRIQGNEQWRLVLRHDGKRVASTTARPGAGDDDVELDRVRPNTSGKDVFKVRATRLATGAACTAKVVLR